ncbi:MAG: hypothetical protein C5B53_07230 [Candidatus Melainabacteria bacterium]|nr:MAG: hypothetical protein C5B53_07230 [Candidatus Melainabacteria bacterium]
MPQLPLTKPYVAVYRVVDPADPNKVHYDTYTSDGNGHLRVDHGDDYFQIFDCNAKRCTFAKKSKRVYYFIDKTVDSLNCFVLPEIIDEGGLQNEVPDFDHVTNPRALSRVPSTDIKLGLGYKQHSEPKDFLGYETVDSHVCHHYFSQPSLQLKSEMLYCPELNCCIKYSGAAFGKSHITTLDKYSNQIDPNVFDMSNFRQAPASQVQPDDKSR